MRPRIKICGITTLEDARFCAGAGADYLGFVQHKSSPRYVSPSTVRAIKEWIHGVPLVGVFVDVDAAAVNMIAVEAGFDYVQLHGSESPAYCHRMRLPVIKAHRVRPESQPGALANTLNAFEKVSAWQLLDTWHPTLPGGTGQAFDWSVAAAAGETHSIMLAGGLDPDNVSQAVATARPWGIDMSSGLEYAPGKKDFDRIRALFERLES